MQRTAPKTAKAMIFKPEFRSRKVGAKRGRGSYTRKSEKAVIARAML